MKSTETGMNITDLDPKYEYNWPEEKYSIRKKYFYLFTILFLIYCTALKNPHGARTVTMLTL